MTVWRMIVPLLDERTVKRVVWVKDHTTLTEYLSEKFEMTDIPKWLGGEASEGDEPMRLYNGFIVRPEEMKGRFT